jgi:hypothetical protein
MQWTSERSSWLGTRRERSGRWHGVPYVVSTSSRRGRTRMGWIVVALALAVLAVVVLVEELI